VNNCFGSARPISPFPTRILEAGYLDRAQTDIFSRREVTPDQIGAARALLSLEQAELTARTHVSVVTIRRLERGQVSRQAARSTLAAVRKVLEEAGAEFIRDGVRRRRRAPPDTHTLYEELRAISLRSAARLQGRELLTDRRPVRRERPACVIIVDTSALIAILRREPEADSLLLTIANAEGCLLSSVSFLETSMVLAGRSGDATEFDALITRRRSGGGAGCAARAGGADGFLAL
jgi:transcriptional regulator with XRE-family HTH domain